MSTRQDATESERDFQVVSVNPSAPPVGLNQGNWYRYVIARKNSTIVGNMRGTLEEVTRHAENVADDLNYRNDVSKGGLWSSRNRQ